MLKEKTEEKVDVLSEYYKAKRKAIVELAKARKQLHSPKKKAKKRKHLKL